MTRRTEMVIWMVNELGFTDYETEQLHKALRHHTGDEENLSGSADKGCRYHKMLVL